MTDEKNNVGERLSAFLDGELTAAEVAEVEARLADDAELRAELEELAEIKRLVGGLDRVAAPPSVAAGVRQQLERQMLLAESETAPPSHGWAMFARITAVAAAVLIGATLAITVWQHVYAPMPPEDGAATAREDKLNEGNGARVARAPADDTEETPDAEGNRSRSNNLARMPRNTDRERTLAGDETPGQADAGLNNAAAPMQRMVDAGLAGGGVDEKVAIHEPMVVSIAVADAQEKQKVLAELSSILSNETHVGRKSQDKRGGIEADAGAMSADEGIDGESRESVVRYKVDVNRDAADRIVALAGVASAKQGGRGFGQLAAADRPDEAQGGGAGGAAPSGRAGRDTMTPSTDQVSPAIVGPMKDLRGRQTDDAPPTPAPSPASEPRPARPSGPAAVTAAEGGPETAASLRRQAGKVSAEPAPTDAALESRGDRTPSEPLALPESQPAISVPADVPQPDMPGGEPSTRPEVAIAGAAMGDQPVTPPAAASAPPGPIGTASNTSAPPLAATPPTQEEQLGQSDRRDYRQRDGAEGEDVDPAPGKFEADLPTTRPETLDDEFAKEAELATPVDEAKDRVRMIIEIYVAKDGAIDRAAPEASGQITPMLERRPAPTTQPGE